MRGGSLGFLLFCSVIPFLAGTADAIDQVVIRQTANHTQSSVVPFQLGYAYIVHHRPTGETRQWEVRESDVSFSATRNFVQSVGNPTPNGENVPFPDTSTRILGNFHGATAVFASTVAAQFGSPTNTPPILVSYRRRLSLYESTNRGATYVGPVDEVELVYEVVLVRQPSGTSGVSQAPQMDPARVNFYATGHRPAQRPGVAPKPCFPCEEAGVCGIAGAKQAGLNSALYRISLGPSRHGVSGAGFITLEAEVPQAAMYEPAFWGIPTGDPDDFRRIRGSATDPSLIQYEAPTAVFTVLDPVIGDQSYQILGYHREDAQPQADGSHTFVGDPFVTYTVANPDTGGTVNRLRVTRTAGGQVEEDLFAYHAASAAWSLENPESGWRRSLAKTTESSTLYHETRTDATPDGVTRSVSRTSYAVYGFGTLPVAETLDPDGAALTTEREYYSNATANGSNRRQVKVLRDPRSGWRRFVYQDVPGTATPEPSRIVSQFLDSAEAAPDDASRVLVRTYLTGTPSPFSYQESETLLGQEIARTFRIVRPDQGHDDIVALAPGVAWNDAAQTLVTQRRFIFGGEFDRLPLSVTYPDGTRTLYRYQTDAGTDIRTTTVEHGVPDAEDSSRILEGTRSVTLTNPAGETVAVTHEDIASGLTIASRLTTAQDRFGRPLAIETLQGVETRSYDCCRMDRVVDPAGLVTQFGGSGTSRFLTSLGVTWTTQRSGGIDTLHRSAVGVSPALVSLSETDRAGRWIRTVDAAGRETSYTETIDPDTAYRTRTILRPDGGTVVATWYPDGQLQSVTGTAISPRKYVYGVENHRSFVTEIRLGDQGEELDWTRTDTDFAGRVVRVERSHESGIPSVTTHDYNAQGQRSRSVDPDGVVTLFAYNALGELVTVALDMDRDGVIDRDGTDRITEAESSWTLRDGAVVRRTVERVHLTDGDPAGTVVRTSDVSADGLHSWVTVGGATTHTATELLGDGNAVTSVTRPDGTREITQVTGGRTSRVTEQDNAGARLTAVDLAHDPLGRLLTRTDARNGATSFTWHPDDQLASLTTPDPGDGTGPRTTVFSYDSAGRLDTTLLPDGAEIDRDWSPREDLQRLSGSGVLPVEYAYDSQGRLRTMTTAGGITTWRYHPESGRLASKRHGDGFGPTYQYTAAGRIASRLSGRGITTIYGYGPAGDLTGITYSDDTPGLSYLRTRRGQIASVTHGGAVTAFTYDLLGQTESESVTGGPLGGWSVDPGYDGLFRRNTLSVGGSGWTQQQSYRYDGSGRLSGVTAGNLDVSYGYAADSHLLQSITSATGGTTVLTATRHWDALDRLGSLGNLSPAWQETFTYRHDSADRRDRVSRADGSSWDYAYDDRGQLTAATRKLPDGDALAGHGFSYAYDAIGNRTAATFGLAGNRTVTYNAAPGDGTRYASIAHPGVAFVTGEADPAADVTVDGEPPASRQSDRFAHELVLDNAGGPVAMSVTIQASLGGESASETREAFVPASVVTPEYDLDGNLVFDGFLEYAWDAENRLKSLGVRSGLSPPGSVSRDFRIAFTYDHAGRRIRRQVWHTLAGQEVPSADELYVHDGGNRVAVLDADTKLPRQTYLWGLDLSQSLDGAGGVGGLLRITDHTDGTSHVPAYDGNGNVIALLDANGGVPTARYDYDPFGNLLASEGPFARRNPWRFSTKPQDALTGHYAYGFRDYDPASGRWLSRDPIGEDGGVNLYGFVGNAPTGWIDVLGQNPVSAYRQAQQRSEDDVEAILTGRMEGLTGRNPASDALAEASELVSPILQAGEVVTSVGAPDVTDVALVGGAVGVGKAWGWLSSWLKRAPKPRCAPKKIDEIAGGEFDGDFDLPNGTALREELREAELADVDASPVVEAPNTPPTPSKFARSAQGVFPYTGVDRFRDITLKKGTIIYGGEPGQSAFYTTGGAIRRVGDSAAQLWNGLQVQPHKSRGYRAHVTAYEVIEDVPAAFGRALENGQFGPGGLPQIVVPEFQKFLRPIHTAPLSP